MNEEEIERLRKIADAAQAVINAYNGDTIYAIETKDRTFMDALDRLDDALAEETR